MTSASEEFYCGNCGRYKPISLLVLAKSKRKMCSSCAAAADVARKAQSRNASQVSRANRRGKAIYSSARLHATIRALGADK
jgi:ribosomal protein S27AE